MELNRLKLTGGDVGGAHLKAHTLEKVCSGAGPEFGSLEGHSLVTLKAPHGLCVLVQDSTPSLLTHCVHWVLCLLILI